MTDIIDLIKTKFNRLPGILYCLTRKECEKCAEQLQMKGISAKCYHAGMTDKARNLVQTDWVKNKVHVCFITV